MPFSPTAPFADADRTKIEYRASIQCMFVYVKVKHNPTHFFFMRAGCFEGSVGSRNLVMARESSLNSTGFVTYELKPASTHFAYTSPRTLAESAMIG